MKQALQVGGSVEMLTRAELSEELAQTSQAFFRQFGRGIKYLRFGPGSAVPDAGSVVLDGSSGQAALGPRAGFVWVVRRLTVWGLTSGGTPDVVFLYRNAPQGIPVWQISGDNPFAKFSKLEMTLLPGEYLSLSGDSLTATGQITLSGDALELAAEELSKIA